MTLELIWEGTQKVYGLSIPNFSTSRSKVHIRMKWLAMAMAHEKGYSFAEIGRFFHMHHTSVMSALQKIKFCKAEDADVQQFSKLEKFLTQPETPRGTMQNVREKLPNDRTGVTLHFTIIARKADGEGTEEIDGYLSTGEYSDGRLAEIFMKVGKQGDDKAMWDSWCELASIALQYGAPVESLLGRFVNKRFEPSGAVMGVSNIRRCTSPLDLVCRYLLLKYGKSEVQFENAG